MRFTAVQRIINDEQGLAIWNYSAYYLRFQREFDKYTNVGGRVTHIRLVSILCGISDQCRIRSDAIERGV